VAKLVARLRAPVGASKRSTELGARLGVLEPRGGVGEDGEHGAVDRQTCSQSRVQGPSTHDPPSHRAPLPAGLVITSVRVGVAWAALGTELGIALTFTVAALAALRPRRAVPRRVLVAAALASLAGIGFALNLALLTGDAAPWTLADPFGSGVAVEYLA
jgi:hypothetical protein